MAYRLAEVHAGQKIQRKRRENTNHRGQWGLQTTMYQCCSASNVRVAAANRKRQYLSQEEAGQDGKSIISERLFSSFQDYLAPQGWSVYLGRQGDERRP